ncbi:hypothetical protein PVAP13_2KG259616 [Panicum virgatum]|uniref:Uncharacterized protein n=1 Tax=Panicum virgatum TaxID=38727 RepID=A0A8T0WGD0_PANVG|nr:hypothetical protein PVAP13_2KG259616 [Panicum virgatum]
MHKPSTKKTLITKVRPRSGDSLAPHRATSSKKIMVVDPATNGRRPAEPLLPAASFSRQLAEASPTCADRRPPCADRRPELQLPGRGSPEPDLTGARERGEGRREGRAAGQHGAARSPRPHLTTVPPGRASTSAYGQLPPTVPPPPHQGARSAWGPCSSAAARPHAGSSSSMNALGWARLEETTRRMCWTARRRSDVQRPWPRERSATTTSALRLCIPVPSAFPFLIIVC